MRSLRRHRLAGLLAAVALLLASSAFLAHVHAFDGVQHDELRCELCPHFHGTAGPSAAPALAPLASVALRLGAPGHEQLPVPARRVRIHGARAPPHRAI